MCLTRFHTYLSFSFRVNKIYFRWDLFLIITYFVTCWLLKFILGQRQDTVFNLDANGSQKAILVLGFHLHLLALIYKSSPLLDLMLELWRLDGGRGVHAHGYLSALHPICPLSSLFFNEAVALCFEAFQKTGGVVKLLRVAAGLETLWSVLTSCMFQQPPPPYKHCNIPPSVPSR